MTSDRTLGAGVYRLLAEEYRADAGARKTLIASGHPDSATLATDAKALAAHLAIAEAMLNTEWHSPRRFRWHWPWSKQFSTPAN